MCYWSSVYMLHRKMLRAKIPHMQSKCALFTSNYDLNYFELHKNCNKVLLKKKKIHLTMLTSSG